MKKISRFLKTFDTRLTQRVGTFVANEAKSNVRVDTGNLRNTITADRVDEDTVEVFTDEVYAAAQEYGRPDIPAYGFTPYLRPAAAKANQQMPKLSAEAARAAARGVF